MKLQELEEDYELARVFGDAESMEYLAKKIKELKARLNEN